MTYPWVESFWTLQGEGYWVGKPAYFIRLGGCDVGCAWCDTRYSWQADKFPKKTVSELVEPLKNYKVSHVVITGGEPTLYDLEPLVEALHQAGYFIQLETSGAYPLRGSVDWITFSPKRFKEPLESYFTQAHELKIVIHDRSDLDWAEDLYRFWSVEKPAYLQPQWYQPASLAWILEHLKAHPYWRLSFQAHRYVDLP